jgi:hypothetical protein
MHARGADALGHITCSVDAARIHDTKKVLQMMKM